MKGITEESLLDVLQEFAEGLESSQAALLGEVREAVRSLEDRLEEALRESRSDRERIARMESRLASLEARPDGGADPPPKDPQAGETVLRMRRRHPEIWQLAKAGADAITIARRAKRPLGEVRLILRLMDPPGEGPEAEKEVD